jgi:DNA-binding NarL/FixJ family response regulator
MSDLTGTPAREGEAAHAVRVVLADGLRMVRSAVHALLDDFGGVQVVGEAGTCEELLTAVETEGPHLVITEVALPGGDAIETIARLHQRYPGLHILVLAASEELDMVRRAMECGAHGYIVKTAHAFELEQAVTGIEAGAAYFSPSITQAMLGTMSRHDGLTARQVEVLSLLVRGHSSRQIAEHLGLSAKTVDVHRARIMRHLHIDDLASLARYAVRHGLVGA